MTQTVESGERTIHKGANVPLHELSADLGEMTAVLEVAASESGEPLDVDSVIPRHTPDQASRRQQLADSGLLFGSLRVPGAVNTIVLRADLRSERVRASIRIKAPRTGRPRTRVNWLLRQLPDARESTRIDVRTVGGKVVGSRTLGVAREDADLLAPEKDVDIRQFEVSVDMPMGAKRGVGRGSMITSCIEVIDLFYADVVQHLRLPST